MEDENIHVGPSDYVPWQKDNKICFIRMEGQLFGDVPMDLELRLSVEDSPNSAGVAIDMIRCCKLALMNGFGGRWKGRAPISASIRRSSSPTSRLRADRRFHPRLHADRPSVKRTSAAR